MLRSGRLCAEGLCPGHLRAEDLLPEASLQEGPDLPSEDLRAEGLLRSGCLRAEDLLPEASLQEGSDLPSKEL